MDYASPGTFDWNNRISSYTDYNNKLGVVHKMVGIAAFTFSGFMHGYSRLSSQQATKKSYLDDSFTFYQYVFQFIQNERSQ